MPPRSKGQRTAQMVPTARPLRLKKMAPKSKRRRMSMKRTRKLLGKRKKVRAKKTLTKRQKEKKVRKRKMVRVKKKKRGMTKLYYGHPTSSFRTTYTKYATSSSSLLSKSKKRSTATVRKKKTRQMTTPKKTREMPDQSSPKNMTEHQL